MTDTRKPHRQYRRPKISDLTPNELWLIKAATRVDLLNPPTVAHGDAALIWYAAKQTDEPLVFQDLLNLPLDELSEYIPDDEDADEPEQTEDDAAETPDPTTVSEPDGPKASTSSPSESSDSPSDSVPPPQPSESAPSASSD